MTTTTAPQPPRPQPPTHEPAPAPTVPLGIWPVAQQSAQVQRAGRYLPECAEHPGKMLPELARRIVAEYSAPGELVCDPMAGIGTTLAEAALLDRRAVGVELDARWTRLARANLDHMLSGPARDRAEVRRGDARRLGRILGELAGQVDLVVTSPPYACDAGIFDPRAHGEGRRSCVADSLNYSTDRANLGHARGPAYAAAMAEVYAACHSVLRPGGRLVVVTKNTRRAGRSFDLAALTVSLVTAAGFSYLGHVIALHAAIRDGDLVARPSFWQRVQVRHAHERGEPLHLVTHEDLTAYLRDPSPKETARAH
ncbi:MAG: DNA methyltransferase [Actinomycetota bacterium]|nr:DNA methyltransferase [Actinomycetota bacterium]